MSAGTLPTYPVRVEGHLDRGLSRWLWLVKWYWSSRTTSS